MRFTKYLVSRVITFLLVIWIGVSVVFIIPRLLPTDPVESMIGQLQSKSGSMDPASVDAIRASLNDSFGLEGSVFEQYVGFFKRVLITQDFGPALSAYPVSVNEMVARIITGAVSIDEWDSVVAEIESMGIEECIEVQQAALDRYNAR